MTSSTVPCWESKRTQESRQVENALRKAGFERVDAYRYNSASIRVRVVDSRFDQLSSDERDAMVEPYLDQLPERIQADIVNLFTFAPSELTESPQTLKQYLLNVEFEDPSPSML